MASKEEVPDRAFEEVRLFTEEEYRQAYAFILPEPEARDRAKDLLAPNADDPSNAEWQISSDLLDLLSLVSDDCAKRVATILNLSPEDALKRKLSFAAFNRIKWP